MRITVTRRGCEISDELRTRARATMERLAKYGRRPLSGHVLFKEEGIERRAELRLHTAAGHSFHVIGTATNFRTALDRARDKLRRKLEGAHVKAGRR